MVDLASKALEIRIEVIKMLAEAGSGHTGGALGLADLFAFLYWGGGLRVNPKEPLWSERDKLVLSCGHTAPVLYATLALAGFFSVEKLSHLRKMDSILQGHPERYDSRNPLSTPGVEHSGGPLGLGVSVSVGMALADLIDNKKRNVVCVTSDGEQQEGQVWEAYMSASAKKLGQLWFVIDRNNIQISGPTEDVMPLEPLREKLRSFGLRVMEVAGDDFAGMEKAFDEGRLFVDQPKAIILHTVLGKGVSFMENKAEWHGKAPSRDEAERAIKELKGEK